MTQNTEEHQHHESILILDRDSRDVVSAISHIAEQLPNLTITQVQSLERYKEIVNQSDFDVVILDYDLSGSEGVELIHELRLKDYEPAVLIVSRSVESKIFTEVYNSGCHRYIVKDGERWKEEIGPAVRHLLRIRKLEAENRKLMAKLTEANQMLAEKNKRLDEFSATLAHDIRGPLGGICMKLEYILETHSDSLSERLKLLLSRAFQSADRLTHIVQAMYEFAKLGSKATQMNVVDLKTLVEEVLLDINVDESREISVGIGDLGTVWGNADLLRRVFINLVQNAIKYNDKPEVIINIGTTGTTEKTLANFVEVFVEDNGPGIPEADQKDIFSIFNRGSNPSGKTEGLGLGLSVVQRIVELHFGKISVSSKPGEGTRFAMSLPLEKIDLLK